MILRQFLHTDPVVAARTCSAAAGKRLGAVVDPGGSARASTSRGGGAGLPLRYVIDTHVHADHLSTGRRSPRRRAPSTSLHASCRGQAAAPAVSPMATARVGQRGRRVRGTCPGTRRSTWRSS